MDKWGYSYLIDLKTLWEKEKLLVTSNFSFSYHVFKICLLLMRQNEYICSKDLNSTNKGKGILYLGLKATTSENLDELTNLLTG